MLLLPFFQTMYLQLQHASPSASFCTDPFRLDLSSVVCDPIRVTGDVYGFDSERGHCRAVPKTDYVCAHTHSQLYQVYFWRLQWLTTSRFKRVNRCVKRQIRRSKIPMWAIKLALILLVTRDKSVP